MLSSQKAMGLGEGSQCSRVTFFGELEQGNTNDFINHMGNLGVKAPAAPCLSHPHISVLLPKPLPLPREPFPST